MAKDMQFLVFSDIHFHEWKPYSHSNSSLATLLGEETVLPYMQGCNSRLFDCAKVLMQIAEYAYEHDINTVLFAGDMVHSKKNVTKDVMNIITLCFSDIWGKYPDIMWYMIPGNHDYIDREGTNHSLIPLMNYNNVEIADICNGNDFLIRDSYGTTLSVRAVPFIEDKEKLKRAINSQVAHADFHVLLFHTGFQGAKIGSDYIMLKDHDLAAEDIHTKKFDACFSGHFHEPQKLFPNGWMVGATHQHVWTDAGCKRGFLHVTLGADHSVSVEHIPTTRDVPHFHVLTQGDDISDVRPHDIVKYKVSEEITEELKESIYGMFHMIIGAVPNHLELIPAPAPKSEAVTISEKATSTDNALELWLDQANTELDKDELLRLGKELLAEAQHGE